MRWYFPSWNGDLRLEVDPQHKDATLLSVIEPTAHEQVVLKAMETVFRQKGWWESEEPLYQPPKGGWLRRKQKMVTTTIYAPLHAIAPVVARHVKAGRSTLSAIRFENGKVLVVEGTEDDLTDAMRLLVGEDAKQPAFREPGADAALAKRQESATAAPEPPPKPKAAASVRRPTPSCPQCIPGAVLPATEALLDFLSPEQHASWAKDRCLVAVGAFTGVRYLLAHRHSERAQRIGRVCYSIDDGSVVHFHASEVPPEEEVLAAMLILQHREHWLRNEATMLGGGTAGEVFKNPFGDFFDGVYDASFLHRIGDAMGFKDPRTSATVMMPNPVVYTNG